MLRYRIELGSYRQGDRRFAIRVAVAAASASALPAPVAPTFTPPVYVASKVKRPRARLADDGDDDDDDRVSSSPPPAPKRANHGSGRGPHLPALGSDAVADLSARLGDVERLLAHSVLPALARIERRLGTTTGAADDDGDPDGVAGITLDGDHDALFGEFAPDAMETSWADCISGMGNGLDEAFHSLAREAARTAPARAPPAAAPAQPPPDAPPQDPLGANPPLSRSAV